MSSSRKATEGIVALFNASDDTIDLIQTILTEAGGGQSLVWSRFADLKQRIVDFEKFLTKRNPEVAIFDISPPYDENWQFVQAMRHSDVMRGRGWVVITSNKHHLDAMLGRDSEALELLGQYEDLKRIGGAIAVATEAARSQANWRRIANSTLPRPASSPTPCAVALFNASDDTFEMVQRMLTSVGVDCLAGCHFADLKKGNVDFTDFLAAHDPQVVIFDISPPYAENWQFFKSLLTVRTMERRGLVLTTTNKHRLDEVTGTDTAAIEIVGKPYDLRQIRVAITAALQKAVAANKISA
jgi:hypothetical protein